MPEAGAPFDFELLIQELKEDRVVPIIGTELYVDTAGNPIEQVVAARLASELGLATAPAQASVRDIALRYMSEGKGHLLTFKAKLRQVTDELAKAELPRPLERLAAIEDIRLYVTTALDGVLEAALTAAGRRPISIAHVPGRLFEMPTVRGDSDAIVCHLFGTATSSFAVTDADIVEYMRSLLDETQRPVRLFDELRDRNLLFLGCGFSDWLTRFFIRAIQDSPFSRDERRAQFIADGRVACDRELSFFLNYHKLFLYPPGRAPEFVEQLHDLWSKRAAPEPPELLSPKANIEKGAIFLSFSSENRDIVRAIADVIRTEAKIPVWFDETDISAGDIWDQMIIKNLLRADLFVPFVSKQTQNLTGEQKYFWREWNLANDRFAYHAPGTEYLFPVSLDADIGPDNATVPENFKKAQWFRLPERKATAAFIEALVKVYRAKQQRRVA
jgi:hypothetical protein